MRTLRWVPVVALAALASLAACSEPGSGAAAQGRRARGPLLYPVEVVKLDAREVEYQVHAVGTIEAFEQVQVTARVAGAVERVRFVEGDEVARGAPLVDIDPDRYRIAVDAARAVHDKAVAAEAEARLGLQRREALNAKTPGLVREEELESFRTRARTAAAEVAQARAALELAQVNARDAHVRAPVAGTIQTRTVQTGQYVQPGTVLATLLRRDPLLLKFEVPEREAASLQPQMPAYFRLSGSPAEIEARISHVAGAADSASRMVSVVARIGGAAAGELRPGAFTEVRVPVGSSSGTVVPQTAIRPSERGFLAFVVEDGGARERILTLGMRTADGRVEVREGLAAGEWLVVRGAEALHDGARVRVAGAGREAPAGGAAAADGTGKVAR